MAVPKAKPSIATTSVEGIQLSLDRVAQVCLMSRVSGTNDYSEVFTLKQTAAYLRISKAHLSNVITGRVLGVPPLRHARAGRRILIKREWADEWLEIAARESLRQW